jgi:hypothetical protein
LLFHLDSPFYLVFFLPSPGVGSKDGEVGKRTQTFFEKIYAPEFRRIKADQRYSLGKEI